MCSYWSITPYALLGGGLARGFTLEAPLMASRPCPEAQKKNRQTPPTRSAATTKGRRDAYDSPVQKSPSNEAIRADAGSALGSPTEEKAPMA